MLSGRRAAEGSRSWLVTVMLATVSQGRVDVIVAAPRGGK
jgi:hypothetical protein